MCLVWLKRNNSSLSYEGLNKLQIQTTLDKLCWQMPKNIKSWPKTYKNSFLQPHFPFQCWKNNSKMQTSVTWKVFSQHCTGVGRGKTRREHNFPTLMAKVVVMLELISLSGYLSFKKITLRLPHSSANRASDDHDDRRWARFSMVMRSGRLYLASSWLS